MTLQRPTSAIFVRLKNHKGEVLCRPQFGKIASFRNKRSFTSDKVSIKIYGNIYLKIKLTQIAPHCHCIGTINPVSCLSQSIYDIFKRLAPLSVFPPIYPSFNQAQWTKQQQPASPNQQYLNVSLAVKELSFSLFGKWESVQISKLWVPGGQRTSLETLILQLKARNFLQENKQFPLPEC